MIKNIILYFSIYILSLSCDISFINPENSSSCDCKLELNIPELNTDKNGYYLLKFNTDYIQTFTKIHADIGQSYEKVGWTSNTYFDGCVFGYCEPVNVVNSASYSNSDGIAYTMMGVYEEHIGDTVIVYCGYYNMETQYLDSVKIIID